MNILSGNEKVVNFIFVDFHVGNRERSLILVNTFTFLEHSLERLRSVRSCH